jgi:MazG family protein
MIEFDELVQIIKRLRHPVTGCPWDIKQTEESLQPYIIEESFELIEAIREKSLLGQMEECGDLLLQIIILARIQQEKNGFQIRDVLKRINRKLIERHPHVFGEVNVTGVEEVKQNWEKIKKKEKKSDSIISSYPADMPALLCAKRISEQASSVGFDWQDALRALEKVEEEVGELKEEIKKDSHPEIENELGDALFALTNVARLAKVNPELALKNANERFIKRFHYIETSLKESGKDIYQTSLPEMEALWQEAKKNT